MENVVVHQDVVGKSHLRRTGHPPRQTPHHDENHGTSFGLQTIIGKIARFQNTMEIGMGGATSVRDVSEKGRRRKRWNGPPPRSSLDPLSQFDGSGVVILARGRGRRRIVPTTTHGEPDGIHSKNMQIPRGRRAFPLQGVFMHRWFGDVGIRRRNNTT